MKTASLDLETIADAAAMARAGYEPTDEYTPFTLQQIACASLLIVDETNGALDFRIESFSRDDHGEAGIVCAVERELASVSELLTYNGSAHDLPVLLARGLLGEVAMPAIRRFATRSLPGRHVDLLRDVRSYGASPVSLRHLCAPLQIPVKNDPQTRVADLAAPGDWEAIERYCETDTVAAWIAAQIWGSTTDPEYGQQRWRTLAAWIMNEQPRLAHLLCYATPPAWPLSGRCLGDDSSVTF